MEEFVRFRHVSSSGEGRFGMNQAGLIVRGFFIREIRFELFI